MGIFSRFRDIVSANLNSMLERAEDPEKMIKLMIQEMEDTLVELKASCAGAMASKTRVSRILNSARERAEDWQNKAKLAIEKGREDLAREALVERRTATAEADARDEEIEHFAELISQYQDEIRQLEEKLAGARNKHRILVQRHIQASKRKESQTRIRKANTSDAFVRFDQFESRIERMEADADLVNHASKSPTLEDEFEALERDEGIESELASLKAGLQKDKDSTGA
jgi:phage shock protein A